MKRLALAALLFTSVCGTAHASGSASATMEVSFVIRAACVVQAAGTAAQAAPQVECSQGTGYQVVRAQAAAVSASSAQTSQPSSAAQAGDAWQIVF